MRNLKIVYAAMLPDIGYERAGVVELARQQQHGFAYINP